MTSKNYKNKISYSIITLQKKNVTIIRHKKTKSILLHKKLLLVKKILKNVLYQRIWVQWSSQT